MQVFYKFSWDKNAIRSEKYLKGKLEGYTASLKKIDETVFRDRHFQDLKCSYIMHMSVNFHEVNDLCA